jgi:hypothetical protein
MRVAFVLDLATSNLSTFGRSMRFTELGEMVLASLPGIVRGQFQ